MHVVCSRKASKIDVAESHAAHTVQDPTWKDIENAIRNMDPDRFPAVQLHRSGDAPEELFCVIGGAGKWYLVDSVLRWEFSDPNGSEELVLIWEDEDMECKQRNLLSEQARVLRITKRFYDTGSFDELYQMR